jgi:hypothetical protein
MILICLWSRFRLRYSRQKRNLPIHILYLGVSHPFTQVYEMVDWKTLLLKVPFFIMPSCAQTKKQNHTGETKSWSPAGSPIYSSKEINSRFQAGGPVYISTEENNRLPVGGPAYNLRKGDIQPLAALSTYFQERESLLLAIRNTSCYTFPIHHSISSNHLSLTVWGTKGRAKQSTTTPARQFRA